MANLAIIGADIGTGSCKVVAFDLQAQIITSCDTEYPTLYPQWGWAEQDPFLIVTSLTGCLAHVAKDLRQLGYDIAAVGLSSVFHSVLAVDKDHQPVTNCLIWADNRSMPQVEEIKKTIDPFLTYSRTGCPLHPMYLPGKLLWLKQHLSGSFQQAAKFLSIKEFVIASFFDQYLVDRSVASATGLYNFQQSSWDQELLDLLGIQPCQLSKIVSPNTVLTGLKKKWEEATGIPVSVPWVIGAGDGVLSTLGTGALEPGVMTAMVGTSGALRVCAPEPKIDPKGRTWCYHLTDGYWVLGGAINNGGIIYRWVRDNFFNDFNDGYDELNNAAQQVAPGSDGLIFLPYLAGERSPYWNANARGILFGLSLEHQKKHLVRATMEGVAYQMFSVLQALEDLIGQADEIRATGGFVRSPLWLQIMSDVFGRAITVPPIAEGSARGAALLAMASLDLIPSLQATTALTGAGRTFKPEPTNHAIYQQLFDIYERIYWKVQDEYLAVAEFQRRKQMG